jgi:hypothetical protein
LVQINSVKFDRKIRPFPGYFEVQTFKIDGTDFNDQWIQIDDFESIFNSTKSARITIVDTRNLLKTTPILGGGELVSLSITDGVRIVDYALRLYRVSDRQQIRQGVLSYVLHLCSEEAWADSFIRVSKSYMKSKLEEKVKDVLSGPQFLKSVKPLVFGETIQGRSLVIPYWSPLHAITWMAGRAQSSDPKYRGGTYIFYETIDGFRWVAIDNLLDETANVPYATLLWKPLRHSLAETDTFDPRGPQDVMNMEDMKVVNTVDSLSNSREGMFANRVRTVDIVDRTWKDTDFNYVKTFYDHVHLKGLDGASATPITGFSPDAAGFPEANLRLVIKHKGLFDDEPDGNSKIEEWLSPKLSQMQQLENFKIAGTLPGHLGLTVGMIVNFSLPNPQDLSINSQSGVDEAYSGQYLVTSMRRMFQRNRFTLQVELCKDSRGGSLGG